jgi:predicted nucleic acid-binding protein
VILVDSSVWVDFLRGEERAARRLRAVADREPLAVSGMILHEVLRGSRTPAQFNRYQREMELWHRVPETGADFVESARLYARLRWAGDTVPASDCLVATVALRLALPLYAEDDDFRRIPGLKLYTPPT